MPRPADVDDKGFLFFAAIAAIYSCHTRCSARCRRHASITRPFWARSIIVIGYFITIIILRCSYIAHSRRDGDDADIFGRYQPRSMPSYATCDDAALVLAHRPFLRRGRFARAMRRLERRARLMRRARHAQGAQQRSPPEMAADFSAHQHCTTIDNAHQRKHASPYGH